ncbi:MAG: NAD(P)H-binding protein [Flavobacterium sp.]|nr:NAD(P)H-binding protein [Flavobacterium sp.]
MKVLLIGATGATGKDLLPLLLTDPTITQITAFVRRDFDFSHPKLHAHITDFDNPDSYKHLVAGDVLFSALGTTLKDAGSKQAQKKVDYTYQLDFAKAAKENNVPSLVLVSAANASKSSPFFYAKIKGELEDDIRQLNFSKLIIFQPLSLDRKDSNRLLENLSTKALYFFNSIGLLKSYKPLPTKMLAQAMLNTAKSLPNGSHLIVGQDIRKHV